MCNIVSNMVDIISHIENTASEKGNIRFPKLEILFFFRCDTGIPRGKHSFQYVG